MTHRDRHLLYKMGVEAIPSLESEMGILASSRGEVYGCVFGRDSLISALKLLSAEEKGAGRGRYLPLVEKILRNLAALQGKELNIESGEEPGKIIHEYRPDRHEHLTRDHSPNWYLYPDGIMRIYDSIDSTPLFLIALDRYAKVAGDDALVDALHENALAAISWLMTHADTNGDGFIDYRIHPERKAGGLLVQSWMDSHQSVFREDGAPVVFPVAPVEAQAYAYAAFKAWSVRLAAADPAHAGQLARRAIDLREKFNAAFVGEDETGRLSIAFAIDGSGYPLAAARSSIGHILWAAAQISGGETPDPILEPRMVPRLVQRLLSPDLFDERAGIRTLGSESREFDPMSYHNGSIWPHDTGMIIEGLSRFGYRREAKKVRNALAKAMLAAGTPIELLTIKDDTVTSGQSETGQHACKVQAWSATTLISEFSRSAPSRARRAKPAETPATGADEGSMVRA